MSTITPNNLYQKVLKSQVSLTEAESESIMMEMFKKPDWVLFTSDIHGEDVAVEVADAFVNYVAVVDTTIGLHHSVQPLHVIGNSLSATVVYRALVYSNGAVCIMHDTETDLYSTMVWINTSTLSRIAALNKNSPLLGTISNGGV